MTLTNSLVEFPEPDQTDVFSWGAAELTTELSDLVEQGFPTAEPVVEGFLELMQQGDSGCPGDPYELNPDLTAGCMASTGYYYSGLAEFFPTEDFDFVVENISAETIQLPDLSQLEAQNVAFLVGDFEIVRADGVPFSAGGWLMDGRFGREGESLLFGGITGSWRDPSGLTQWHQAGVSALYLYQLDGNPGQHRLWLDGVLTLYGRHLRFENVEVSEVCEQGFSGSIGVRDPNGLWHDLRSEEACGCAELFSGGVAAGETICVSFAAVLHSYAEHLESL